MTIIEPGASPGTCRINIWATQSLAKFWSLDDGTGRYKVVPTSDVPSLVQASIQLPDSHSPQFFRLWPMTLLFVKTCPLSGYTSPRHARAAHIPNPQYASFPCFYLPRPHLNCDCDRPHAWKENTRSTATSHTPVTRRYSTASIGFNEF